MSYQPNARKMVKVSHVRRAPCPHCGTVTVQVHRVVGVFENACLQCIADGGTCCSLRAYNRWTQ